MCSSNEVWTIRLGTARYFVCGMAVKGGSLSSCCFCRLRTTEYSSVGYTRILQIFWING